MLLHDRLDRWAAERPHSEFAVHGERRMTWREAAERTDRAAAQVEESATLTDPRARIATGTPPHLRVL